MHLRNKLNVKRVASLANAGVYSDGGGLYVRVRGSGTKSWLFIYMQDGKRREIGLGSVMDVSLADARQAAEELRAIKVSGRDPAQVRKLQRLAQTPITTFAEMADELLGSIEAGFRNEKHRRQWRSTIQTYAAPLLPLDINQIQTADILAALQPIWLEKPETASRVRQRIERILDAATAKGIRQGENPARLKGNLEFLLPKRSKAGESHHGALPFAQVPAFMSDLKERPAMAARALEFTILTAARTSEVLGMRWEEIDFDRNVWVVPAERMKTGRIHEVPLSQSAQALLAHLNHSNGRPDRVVFPSARGVAMSNMAMLNLLKRMEVQVTVHGFRSTFRDWAGETTQHSREDIEMALAHVILSKTERAYRRGNALEKRRSLMSDWADFCFARVG